MRPKKTYATKTIILHIWLVLKKYTDADSPVSYTELAKYLTAKDKPCDRKTVARNVDYLIADGFPIGKTADGKCFYKRE